MALSEILMQIQDLENQLTLTLGNPASVKLQMKQITLAQKQLKALKKELNLAIKGINQEATQTGADSLIAMPA
jgi:uncharacterized protein YjbK